MAINLENFRVGNYVQNEDGQLSRITQLDDSNSWIMHYGQGGGDLSVPLIGELVNVVRVTPELLYALGFTVSDNNQRVFEKLVTVNNREMVITVARERISDTVYFFGDKNTSPVFSEIHRLQNLYYEATGQDLFFLDEVLMLRH